MPSRAVKEGLVWPAGAGKLVTAVTRHQSLGPGHIPVPFQIQEAGRSGEETKALDRGVCLNLLSFSSSLPVQPYLSFLAGLKE